MTSYMVTKPVTLKAMLRVCADLAREDAEPADGRVAALGRAARAVGGPAAASSADEGFYERFPPRARSSASRASTASSPGRPASKLKSATKP